MKLRDLLIDQLAADKTLQVDARFDRQVSGLSFDSRSIRDGEVFFLVLSSSKEARDPKNEIDRAKAAIAKGASALVVPEEQADWLKSELATSSTPVIPVKTVRLALAQVSRRFFQEPSSELISFAVTGTNGKTTSVALIESLMNQLSFPTGVMGTIHHRLQQKIYPSRLTTPDPVLLQSRLRDFKNDGAVAAAFEASSHALDQFRLDGVQLNVALFTHLTRDHLDYHGDMEAYFKAKLRLFVELLAQSPKPNKFAGAFKDEYGMRILDELKTCAPEISRVGWGFSNKIESPEDAAVKITEVSYQGTKFEIECPSLKINAAPFFVPLPGRFNVLNATGALLGVFSQLRTQCESNLLASMKLALAQFSGVAGRLESVPHAREFSVFIDYAHTDDALRTVLRSLNETRAELTPQKKGRIITVFGCGGDRDRGKRPLMRKAATELSDLVIVTSDNPRFEDPAAIIADILNGATLSEVAKINSVVDRRQAIISALNLARSNDVILIAGKGHENYQSIRGTDFPFSDRHVVEEVLN